MIPSPAVFDQSILSALLEYDAVVQDYRGFFALLDWQLVEQWQQQHSARGRPGHPLSAYLKAFRIREGFLSTTQLRRFLVKHPLLVIDLGFQLVLDKDAPYGFDVEQTVPGDSWLRHQLRQFDQGLLQALLHATVAALQEEIPGLGEVVAFDVKHISAWVRENNQREHIKDRFCKERQPKGDPDCRVGVKRSTNQAPPGGSKKEVKEYLWGYGSGVAAATDPVYDDVLPSRYTLPCNEADVTYYRPLYQRTVVATKQLPTHVTADAAFDYWYVYDTMAYRGGIAAIPLNNHGHEEVPRDPDGTPRCSAGLRMHPTHQFEHTNGFLAQRFRCPLLFPTRTGQTCEHAQFATGKGCVKDPNWEEGGLMRALLDRDGPLYHAISTQRTCAERINSQVQALGIERPKVRNGHSVENLNTLIYLFINARALQKAISINRGLLQMN